jgi:hypothetical protein
MDEEENKPRRGRPPTKNKKKNPVGRPKDTKGMMREYRDRMLSAHRTEKVLDSIFKAALNDDHPKQAAAWQMIIDRVAPKKLFENEVEGSQGSNRIQVTISTAGGDVNIGEAPQEQHETIDATYSEVNPDDV